MCLVPATRRYRWFLVAGAVLIMWCGAAALFGIPGRLAPLQLETDALTYVNPREAVAQDTRQFVQANGLDVQDLWLQTQPGHALDPEFLRSVDLLTQTARTAPRCQCRRRTHHAAALGALYRIRLRSAADRARGVAEARRRSGADPLDRAGRAQLRRRRQSVERALEHSRPRGSFRAFRRHAKIHSENLE